MERQKRFAVIGSDARQLAAGRALARAGYAVEGPEEIALADYILLPLPLAMALAWVWQRLCDRGAAVSAAVPAAVLVLCAVSSILFMF